MPLLRLVVVLGVVSVLARAGPPEGMLAQVESAVKLQDTPLLQHLCSMINDIDTATKQANAKEIEELDYALFHLGVDLQAAQANLTATHADLNATLAAIAHAHAANRSLVPQLQETTKQRDELATQRDLLKQECNEDQQGQQVRVGAVNNDLNILKKALAHLDKLKDLVPEPDDAALVQLDEGEEGAKEEGVKEGGVVVRCQHGFVVPVSDQAGTITTQSPGNGMHYSNKEQCGFRVSPSGATDSDRVELTFTGLNTVDAVDFVKVYDGAEVNEDRLLKAFSGTTVPCAVRTKHSNQMTITYFAASGSKTTQGFSAQFRLVVNGTAVPMPAGRVASAQAELGEDASESASPALPNPNSPTGCCPADCTSRGICSPSTCTCACFPGFSGDACQTNDRADALLQMDEGHSPETQSVRPLELGPVLGLLDKLQFQLHRSLTYEHGVGNITHRQCDADLEQQSRDLDRLEQALDSLTATAANLTNQLRALESQKAGIVSKLNALQDAVASISARIDARMAAKQARESAAVTESKTLQGMRELITKDGGLECSSEVVAEPEFKATNNTECTGELLETTLSTSEPADCKELCRFGCVAFTFNAAVGCRFFAEVRGHVGMCGGGAASCACYEKV